MATPAPTPARVLNKSEKAAVLLLCMDEKTTGEMFQHLNDDEIRKIGSALLKLRQIPAAQIQTVIEEFGKLTHHKKAEGSGENADAEEIPIDGKKVVEKMMTTTLPKGRGQTILSNIRNRQIAAPDPKEGKNFGKMVADFSADMLFDLVKNEHPQVIAISMAHVKRAVAKAVLEKFPEEMKPELISRIARLEKVPAAALEELGGFVSRKVSEMSSGKGAGEEEEVQKTEESSLQGMSQTLKLLKSMKRDLAMKIVDEIDKVDKELGDRIAKQMFTIEDLARSDDAGIRDLLRGVRSEDLKVALKDSPDAVKNKIFQNMSERAASILREDMEVLPPLKVEEIETAQESILNAAKNLIKEEKMKLADIVDEEG